MSNADAMYQNYSGKITVYAKHLMHRKATLGAVTSMCGAVSQRNTHTCHWQADKVDRALWVTAVHLLKISLSHTDLCSSISTPHEGDCCLAFQITGSLLYTSMCRWLCKFWRLLVNPTCVWPTWCFKTSFHEPITSYWWCLWTCWLSIYLLSSLLIS